MNLNKDVYGKVLILLSIMTFVFMGYVYIKYPFMKVDEGYTMGMVQLPIADMISVTAKDVHSPLYYMIIMALAKINIFSADLIYVMKFASLIPYFLLMILSLTKIKKAYGWLTSGIFLFSVSSMSMFFTYFITARSYSWSLFAIILVFMILRDVLEKNDLKSWILLSLTSALCAYLHYFAAISAITIYLMLFIYIVVKNKSMIKNFLISAVIGILMYLPWMFTLIGQINEVNNGYWIEPVSVLSLLTCFSYYLTSLSNHAIQMISVVILIGIIVVLSKKYLTSREDEDLYLLMGALTFIGTIIIGMIISVIFQPILYKLYVLPASGVLWLVIAIFIPKINSKKVMLAAIVLLILIGGVNVYKEHGLIQNDYDISVKEKKVLDSINNNDSIIIFTSDNRFVRTYWALDNVYEKYASYNLNNKTYTLDTQNLNANYTVFNLPDDLNNFTDKKVYLIVFYGTEINGIDKEKIGEVQHSNVYLLT